ncbi:MAG: hypothetical protein LBN12_02615 [Clostridiales Family XIII bacterium]|jgi:hypothetical protein|nr:hypothetical protein [Clostridiales Family XIII bacterium]
MKQKKYVTVRLPKGEVRVYDLGEAKLHAYQTNDPMTDEVFILEKNGRALIIETPCFTDNIAELTEYMNTLQSRVEAKLLSYHLAAASFLPDIPVYATKKADEFANIGGGRALLDNFAEAFGPAFDTSIPKVTHTLAAGLVDLAGFTLDIVPSKDAFDIEIPALGLAYIHMLGHDRHSIVAGASHADALIAQLKDLLSRGFGMILTSHHHPEDAKDARTKADYLQSLKTLAASSPNAAAFKQAVLQKYPAYTGENYLDMTAALFFPA